MSKALEKIKVEKCLPVLIAPAWPTQSWFFLVLDMSVDHSLGLPLSPKLLKQTDKPFFHSNPGHQKVMPESCKEESPETESSDLNTNLPGYHMEQDGASFVLGASPRKEILSRPLPP